MLYLLRDDEAWELFKTQRAAAKHNAEILRFIYFYGESKFKMESYNVKPYLVEDLRDAYELLFSKDDKQPPALNEKYIQRLKDLAERGKLDIKHIYDLVESLSKTTEYETMNWFLFAALKQKRGDWDIEWCYAGLISNYLAMGDWQNSVKYIDLSVKLKGADVERLAESLERAADLAEQSGAAEDAQRMRERIKNLGSPVR